MFCRILYLKSYLDYRIETFTTRSFKIFLGFEYDLVNSRDKSDVEFLGLCRVAGREEIETAAIGIGYTRSHGIEGVDAGG